MNRVDVQRTVDGMIRNFGPRAFAEAKVLASRCAYRNEQDGARLWLEVAQLARQTLSAAPGQVLAVGEPRQLDHRQLPFHLATRNGSGLK